MIYATVNVTIGDYRSTCDNTIVLYRGDKNVEIRFVLKGNKFTVLNSIYAQMIITRPSTTSVFSEIAPIQNDTVILTISEDMIDELTEVGCYDMQIRLYDDSMKSRVTMPPAEKAIEVREPIAIDESFVDTAMVGYARVRADSGDEEDKRFDENGNYIKTYWEHGDIITAGKLNKVEDSLEAINANDIQNHIDVNEKIDTLAESIDAAEYVTETELNAKGYLTEHQDISGKADKTEIPTKTSQLTNDSGFLTQIPNEYVTETELNAKGYLTEHQDISGKADKTELHNHSNKSVLDDITSSKVTEWDNKSTFSGNYNDLTNKPIIPSIEGLATEDYVEQEINKIDEKLEDIDSEIDTLEQYVKDEVARLENASDIVDSVEEMTDTNKQYVLSSTNTWWRHKTETIQAGSVLPGVDNAIKWDTCTVYLNKRYNSSQTLTNAPGCATFEFTADDAMLELIANVNPLWVRFKGCSIYSTEGNPTSLKVTVWSKGNAVIHSWTPNSQVLAYVEDEDGINNNPMAGTVYLDDNTKAPVYAIKLGYYNITIGDNSTNQFDAHHRNGNVGRFAFSVAINFANTNAITEADLENVYITFDEPIISYETQTKSEWYDTGAEYNPNADKEVVELQTNVASIQTKVNKIENRVEILESKSSTSGGPSSEVSTLPNYWISRLNDIGGKIDTLQKENGMDTLQFLWCSDIHGVPGTSPSNTTYIGEIGRYMMDKHNIPFFMVTGDIMSQAAHGETSRIWAEYDKLIPMLSFIKNEEFLAIKGNHDGAWGSPMEYNGQANQYYHSYIGDKALFNAFMRRQTLDRYKRVFGKDGMYFYIDYHNYRIYMLNGHTFGDNSVNEQGQAIYNGFKHNILGSEQIQWIADTLNTVQENQQVIFACHAQLNQQLDFEVFRTMLSHYKNRTSGSSSKSISETYWGTDAKYSQIQANFDFTKAKGSVVGWFNGHIHTDSIKTDLFDNLPIFTITTAGGDVRDSYYTNGTLTRAKGTATETAIDIVTITSDYIYFTRIGSGYDRKFNRASKEVTIDYDSAYVPPVEPPVDNPDEPEITQGEITDQVTWTADKRLSSSSGGYSDLTGCHASSDIKCSKDDIIRIYGANKWQYYAYIAAYSDTAYLGFITMETHNNAVVASNYISAIVDSNNTLSITILHEKVAYIRVSNNDELNPENIRVSRNLELS